MKPNHSRKFLLNEEFFSTWSAEMAYVLGFWYADGYMRHEKSYRVVFFSNDYDHLEQVAKIMGSNTPIRQAQKGIDCGVLYLHSKKLYSDLEKLGGFRCKSLKIKFPDIPLKYVRDFIRGYFDGDGSVFLVTYKQTKNGKINSQFRSNFTCGSRRFLESIKYALFSQANIPIHRVNRDESRYKLGFCEKDTYSLLRYMYYPGNPISLRRKEVYLDYFDGFSYALAMSMAVSTSRLA